MQKPIWFGCTCLVHAPYPSSLEVPASQGLELGYEDEGYYNYKLQLGQADIAEECDQ